MLEIGMTKAAVEKSLGRPVVPSIPRAEALERLPLEDPYVVENELYGGVFAWVRYGHGRVVSISFTPAAFRHRFGGTQKLIISLHGRALAVGPNTHLLSLIDELKRVRPPVSFISPEGSYRVCLKHTGLCFTFDAETSTLQAVELVSLEWYERLRKEEEARRLRYLTGRERRKRK